MSGVGSRRLRRASSGRGALLNPDGSAGCPLYHPDPPTVIDQPASPADNLHQVDLLCDPRITSARRKAPETTGLSGRPSGDVPCPPLLNPWVRVTACESLPRSARRYAGLAKPGAARSMVAREPDPSAAQIRASLRKSGSRTRIAREMSSPARLRAASTPAAPCRKSDCRLTRDTMCP